jgi:hypothetical protein
MMVQPPLFKEFDWTNDEQNIGLAWDVNRGLLENQLKDPGKERGLKISAIEKISRIM